MSKSIFVLALLVILFSGIYLIYKRPVANQPTKNTDKTVVFYCPKEKFIKATFHLPEDKTVDITLSDKRSFSLPHAISASGARYANADESLVFWNKGDGAFLEEKGVTSYDNCALRGE